MPNNVISADEFSQFRYIPIEKRIDCMQIYLIGINGVRYNMEETARKVFGKSNDSFTVSLIHRCYNFSGKNSGKYREGCLFEQKYGYSVTRRDIEDFVKKYPNGTFQMDMTFEKFLLMRKDTENYNVRNQPRSKNVQKNQKIIADNAKDTNETNDFGIIIFIIGVIGLLILLFTGNIFEHWIISIVLFLMVWVGIDDMK